MTGTQALGQPTVSIPLPYPVAAVACTPSGKRIVVATAHPGKWGSHYPYPTVGSLSVHDAEGTALRRTVDEWAVRSRC